MAKITERETKHDWACFIAEIETRYRDAEKITLVMDDLNTHKPGSLYEAFPPEKAKKLGTGSSLSTPPNTAAGSTRRKSN